MKYKVHKKPSLLSQLIRTYSTYIWMAVCLMTIYLFHHRALDLSHSLSPSLGHGRPWLVLDKLRNKGFTPNSAFTVSLSPFIKMMTKNLKLSHWKSGRSNDGDDNSLYLNVHTMCKIYDTKSFIFFVT